MLHENVILIFQQKRQHQEHQQQNTATTIALVCSESIDYWWWWNGGQASRRHDHFTGHHCHPLPPHRLWKRFPSSASLWWHPLLKCWFSMVAFFARDIVFSSSPPEPFQWFIALWWHLLCSFISLHLSSRSTTRWASVYGCCAAVQSSRSSSSIRGSPVVAVPSNSCVKLLKSI